MVPMRQLSHCVFCRCISSWMAHRVDATDCAKQKKTCRGGQRMSGNAVSAPSFGAGQELDCSTDDHRLSAVSSSAAHSHLEAEAALGGTLLPTAPGAGPVAVAAQVARHVAAQDTLAQVVGHAWGAERGGAADCTRAGANGRVKAPRNLAFAVIPAPPRTAATPNSQPGEANVAPSRSVFQCLTYCAPLISIFA